MIAFRPVEPDKVLFSASITLSLADWKKVAAQLEATAGAWAYPMCDITAGIKAITRQAEKNFNDTAP